MFLAEFGAWFLRLCVAALDVPVLHPAVAESFRCRLAAARSNPGACLLVAQRCVQATTRSTTCVARRARRTTLRSLAARLRGTGWSSCVMAMECNRCCLVARPTSRQGVKVERLLLRRASGRVMPGRCRSCAWGWFLFIIVYKPIRTPPSSDRRSSTLPRLKPLVIFRFFDHNPAPLKLIKECCDDMHAFLSAHPDNVIAVHCKAGKGRTGL